MCQYNRNIGNVTGRTYFLAIHIKGIRFGVLSKDKEINQN
jgi:hypothetical protein